MGIVEHGADVLYGGDLGNRLATGARFQGGLWIDPSHRVGVQQEFFALSNRAEVTEFGSDDQILARPFFNTDPNVNALDAQVFNVPDSLDGTTTFRDKTDVFSSATALRWNGGSSGSANQFQRTDYTLGYRFFRIDDEFSSREQFSPLNSRFVPDTSYDLSDSIDTRNVFHGVEIGAIHARQMGLWGWDLGTSLALGSLRRSAVVDGSTQLIVPGVSNTTIPGGFYVGPEDIGRISDSQFSAIPQVQLNVNRVLGSRWRLRAGYNFLYLHSAFRPTSVMDTTFDGNRLANATADVSDGPTQPDGQGLWLHGLNVGVVGTF